MKTWTKYIVFSLIFILILLPSLGAGAEEGVDFGDEVGYHPETGQVTFIGSKAGSPIAVPGAQAQGFLPGDRAKAILEVYAPLFGEQDPAKNLMQTAVNTQSGGETSTRYQQTYLGIPVFAGELIVNQTDRGELVSMIGELSPELDISIEPAVSAGEAAQTAVVAMAKYYGGGAVEYTASDPELWIYDPRLLEPSAHPQELVWRMEVVGSGDVPVNALVLIDAQRGGISLQFNQIDTFWSSALLAGAEGGSDLLSEPETASEFVGLVPKETYTANNGTALPGTLVCDSDDPDCTATTDRHAIKAHKHAGDTYIFYSDRHGRESVDDAGMTLISTVHYGTGYWNAYWDTDLNQMVYGDGAEFPRADDVVAHEITHGVTQYTSNLLYYMQSGAINESFSDVWGEFVDLTNGRGSDGPADRWLLGEDITGMGAIRSMEDPTIYGDPDKMTSPNYFIGYGDNGGVHYNSGVNNKAVYLMVDGDAFNGYVIDGIGLDKVATIYYDVQAFLLTSGSDYLNLYHAVNQSCQNLIGGESEITAFDCIEVDEAMLAVEMKTEPYVGYNPEAEVCPAGTVPSYVFYENFETGLGNWTVDLAEFIYFDEFGSPSGSGFYNWVEYIGYATSGVWDIWGMDVDGAGAMQLLMASDVSLPTTTDPLYLRFNHYYSFEYFGSEYYDGGILEYSVGGGPWVNASGLLNSGQADGTLYTSIGSLNPYKGQDGFVGETNGFVSSRYDLGAFDGSPIKFRWSVATDQYVGASGWDIDDIQIYSCVAPAVPDAPTGVKASDGRFVGKVEITWDSAANAEWYNVWRDTLVTGASMVEVAGDVVYLGWEDTGAPIGFDYFYWVEACNASGCSAPAGPDIGFMAELLFYDDFETEDFSSWTRFNDGDGYLYPCKDAAINGTWGACVNRGTDKRKQLIDETPVDQVDYRVRFNIDMNSLSMAEGSRFRFVQVKMGAERPFFIVVKSEGGQYLIQLNTLMDDLTKAKSGWYLLSDAPHTIEIAWSAASTPGAIDGSAAFYLDDVLLEAMTGLQNGTIYVDTFKIGFTSRLDGKAISGIFYLDDIATSNSVYIGVP